MSERDLTIKQRKWLKLYIESGNATDAAMKVYDCKDRDSAAHVGYVNVRKLQGRFSVVMEAAGITPALLAEKLKEGLDAKVISRAQKDGKFLDERTDVDFVTRHRYMDTAHKLTGDYAASKHEVSGPDGGPLSVFAQVSDQELADMLAGGEEAEGEHEPDDGPDP